MKIKRTKSVTWRISIVYKPRTKTDKTARDGKLT